MSGGRFIAAGSLDAAVIVPLWTGESQQLFVLHRATTKWFAFTMRLATWSRRTRTRASSKTG